MLAVSQQRNRLETHLEKIYMDRLDGIIDEEVYKRLSNKFRSEVTDLKFRMGQLTAENKENTDSASRLLELAQKAASLYSMQDRDEKRKPLDFVYSNSSRASTCCFPISINTLIYSRLRIPSTNRKRSLLRRKVTFLSFGVPCRI